jgi:hypothetical protein
MQTDTIEEKKHPDEIQPFATDFTNVIPDGDSISDQDVTVQEASSGTDVTDDMLVTGSVQIASNIITCLIQAGDSGTKYYIDFWATMGSGALFLGRRVLKVANS